MVRLLLKVIHHSSRFNTRLCLGMYPGPTIEANQGDRLLVTVQNNLDERTSIHWHGLVSGPRYHRADLNVARLTSDQYQNSTPWYDGTLGITECGIPPGQSLTYKCVIDGFP